MCIRDSDIAGQGSVIYSQSDWALSFSANQSGEACYGTIIDGEEEIGFTITWNYIENITSVEDNEDEEDNEKQQSQEQESKNSKDTIAGVIFAIIILILIVYLMIMMKTPEYTEEE